jgi:phenylpropionate dioxygenase-like ring-hydroxylating dioxygenase large terminal subunit
LIARLRAERATPPPASAFRIDTARYRDADWLARERQAVLAAPRAVLASTALPVGGCVPYDAPTASALLVRAADGRVRAFRNACRHRATRLVDAPCTAKAMVCPYHGWTYALDGALLHAPHADAFAPLPIVDSHLVELPVDERHGLIWLGTDAAAGFLGDLDADLAALDLAGHVVYRDVRVTRRCNWKLVVEAFLDGYHIRTLHRDSIYRFFLDAASVPERVAPHVRAITARRALDEPAAPLDAPPADLRALATPSLHVFPATTFIIHPDFVSVITVDPTAPDATEYRHAMLVPAARAGEHDHWARSWALIEETVFQREDLWVCEQVQRGLVETDHLRYGALEHAIAWFHAELDARVRA